jgi:hypothetical protein
MKFPIKTTIDDVINAHTPEKVTHKQREAKRLVSNALNLLKGYKKGERKGYYPPGYTIAKMYEFCVYKEGINGEEERLWYRRFKRKYEKSLTKARK